MHQPFLAQRPTPYWNKSNSYVKPVTVITTPLPKAQLRI